MKLRLRGAVLAVVACLTFASAPGVAPAAPEQERTTRAAGQLVRRAVLERDAAPAEWNTTGWSRQSSSRRTVRDRRGDAKSATGDLRRASVRYGELAITLTAVPRRMSNPASFNWQYGETALVWLIDTDFDGREEKAVVLYNDGYDGLHVDVVRRNGDLVCSGRYRGGDGFTVTVTSACLGTPRVLRYAAVFFYDTDPRDPNADRAVSIDGAPNGAGWSRIVQRPRWRTRLTAYSYDNRIQPGEAARISVHLSRPASGVQLDGRKVRVLRRSKGSDHFTHIKTRTTGGGYGYFEYKAEPSTTSTYRFVFPGGRRDRRSVVQTTVHLQRAVTTPGFRISTVPRRRPATVSGEVTPAAADTTVWLQRRSSATQWTTVGRTKTTVSLTGAAERTAAWEFTVHPEKAGTYAYRAVVAGNERFSATPSFQFSLEVFAARITRLEAGEGVTADTLRPNNEFVDLRNTGPNFILASSWEITANGIDTARIPHAVIHPGKTLRIYTGHGDDTGNRVYLDQTAPLWPETGGTAEIRDGNGALVSRVQYTGD